MTDVLINILLFKKTWIIGTLIWLCIGIMLFLLFCIFDHLSQRTVYKNQRTLEAKIIETSYIPSSNSTSTATVVTSNGQVGVGVSSFSHPKRFIVVFLINGKKIIENDEGLYAKAIQGETVRVDVEDMFTKYFWQSNDQAKFKRESVRKIL